MRPYMVRRLQARDLPPCAPARQEVERGVGVGAYEVGPPHQGAGAAHAGLGLEHRRLWANQGVEVCMIAKEKGQRPRYGAGKNMHVMQKGGLTWSPQA